MGCAGSKLSTNFRTISSGGCFFLVAIESSSFLTRNRVEQDSTNPRITQRGSRQFAGCDVLGVYCTGGMVVDWRCAMFGGPEVEVGRLGMPTTQEVRNAR